MIHRISYNFFNSEPKIMFLGSLKIGEHFGMTLVSKDWSGPVIVG